MVGSETTLSAQHSSRSSCMSACGTLNARRTREAGYVNNSEYIPGQDAIPAACKAMSRLQHLPWSRAVLSSRASYANLISAQVGVSFTPGLREPEHSSTVTSHGLPDDNPSTHLQSQFYNNNATPNRFIGQTPATSRSCAYDLSNDEPFYSPPRQRFSPSSEPSELSYASYLEDQPQTAPRPAVLPEWLPVVQFQPVSKYYLLPTLDTCTLGCQSQTQSTVCCRIDIQSFT